MKRGTVYVIDWDEASAATVAERLEGDGWTVRTESVDGARAYKHMIDEPPDALVVDLSRLPSLGRDTARDVAGAKALKDVPIVFFGGTDDVRSKASAVVPAAKLTTEEDLPHVLARLSMRAASD